MSWGGTYCGDWDMTSEPVDMNKEKRKYKDSLYPMGIDDLELIDGVYQNKPFELPDWEKRFLAEARFICDHSGIVIINAQA